MKNHLMQQIRQETPQSIINKMDLTEKIEQESAKRYLDDKQYDVHGYEAFTAGANFLLPENTRLREENERYRKSVQDVYDIIMDDSARDIIRTIGEIVGEVLNQKTEMQTDNGETLVSSSDYAELQGENKRLRAALWNYRCKLLASGLNNDFDVMAKYDEIVNPKPPTS